MRWSWLLGLLAMVLLAGCNTPAAHYSSIPPTGNVAVLSPPEAARVAGAYLTQHKLDWGSPLRIVPQGWGYTLAYRTPFQAAARPPATLHLLAVQHDGTVREWVLQ